VGSSNLLSYEFTGFLSESSEFSVGSTAKHLHVVSDGGHYKMKAAAQSGQGHGIATIKVENGCEEAQTIRMLLEQSSL